MAARSIFSLTISFGLVAIPVKLYSATRSTGTIHFHLLHDKDGSRLKQQYVCQKEGVVVDRKDIVKGYEFAKDQYVMFTPEEIKALEEAGSRSIDVTEFVPLESVDPVYFDTTYYLAPDRGGAKPYTLFAMALRERGRCAVGRWASRGKDHVVIVRSVGNGLALHQLHFAPEVVSFSELGVDEAKVREPELKLAEQLIDQQTSEAFDPSAYKDEVRERIQQAIQRKVEGEQISISEPRPAAEGKVVDLMAALRASLNRNLRERGEAADLSERRPPKRAARKAPAHPRTGTDGHGGRAEHRRAAEHRRTTSR